MASESGLPCIKCDSSDAMSTYSDGTGYCFSCNTRFFADQIGAQSSSVERSKPRSPNPTPSISHPVSVPSRGLDEATMAYYGVGGVHSEETGEVIGLAFPVYRDGQLVGSKEKTLATKKFVAIGSTKKPDFFGANKVGEGGKLLIITEGEEDAMSAHQMLRQQGKSYNVVSLPNGANPSAVRNKIEWIESFDTIILNLDDDEIGREAAESISEIITPGKVKIMKLPCKDANEFLLQKKNSKDYLRAVYNAKSYRPDGVVSLADTWDVMWSSENQQSIPYPWEGLNKKLYGNRNREITTWAAGTGVGKSAVMRELEHHLFKNTVDNIGILPLEESVARTAWGIVSVEASLPLSIREEREGVPKEDIKKWFNSTLGTGRIFTLDHFGSTSEENLLNRIRYMIKGLGCKWIVLDHLSIVVSAMDDIGDERKSIDSIMTRLRQLVEETGVGLHLVTHLRRVSGDKGHERGIEVSLSHLRGSQSIAQLSDTVVALERDQQADNDKESNLTTVRVLKNRYAGLTGIATYLAYSPESGRLIEILDKEEYLAENEIGV